MSPSPASTVLTRKAARRLVALGPTHPEADARLAHWMAHWAVDALRSAGLTPHDQAICRDITGIEPSAPWDGLLDATQWTADTATRRLLLATHWGHGPGWAFLFEAIERAPREVQAGWLERFVPLLPITHRLDLLDLPGFPADEMARISQTYRDTEVGRSASPSATSPADAASPDPAPPPAAAPRAGGWHELGQGWLEQQRDRTASRRANSAPPARPLRGEMSLSWDDMPSDIVKRSLLRVLAQPDVPRAVFEDTLGLDGLAALQKQSRTQGGVWDDPHLAALFHPATPASLRQQWLRLQHRHAQDRQAEWDRIGFRQLAYQVETVSFHRLRNQQRAVARQLRNEAVAAAIPSRASTSPLQHLPLAIGFPSQWSLRDIVRACELLAPSPRVIEQILDEMRLPAAAQRLLVRRWLRAEIPTFPASPPGARRGQDAELNEDVTSALATILLHDAPQTEVLDRWPEMIHRLPAPFFEAYGIEPLIERLRRSSAEIRGRWLRPMLTATAPWLREWGVRIMGQLESEIATEPTQDVARDPGPATRPERASRRRESHPR